MKHKPLISIVIPVYNIQEYIEFCIKSVREQTYRKLEIIVIDDGSTDRSGEICDELADIVQRIGVYDFENGGLSMARNRGIEIAKGEAILFLDGDDVLSKTAVESLVNEFRRHKEVAYISFGFRRIHRGDRVAASVSTKFKKRTMPVLLKQLISGKDENISACGKLFPLSNIGKIRFTNGHVAYEDKFFLVCYLIQNNKLDVYETADQHYGYTVREGSITTGVFNKSSLDAIYHSGKIIEIIGDNYPEYIEDAEFSDVVAHLMVLKNIVISNAYSSNRDIFKKVKNEVIRKYKRKGIRFFRNYGLEFFVLGLNDLLYIECVRLFDLLKKQETGNNNLRFSYK